VYCVTRNETLHSLHSHHNPSPIGISIMESTIGVKSWDSSHSKAEIVLISNDGIGFRVDAWYFAQKR
jgi:hypothetical protein